MQLEANSFFQLKRRLKDRLATFAITTGAIAVILTIVLIFLYLLAEVAPLFKPAGIEKLASFPVDRQAKAVHLAVDERGEVLLRVDANGVAEFRDLRTGSRIKAVDLLDQEVQMTSFATASEASRLFALGLSNGSVIAVKHNYRSDYASGERVVKPEIEFPFGESARILADSQTAILKLALRDNESLATMAALLEDRSIQLLQIEKQQGFLTDKLELTEFSFEIPDAGIDVRKMLISENQRFLLLLTQNNELRIFDIVLARQGSTDALVGQYNLSSVAKVSDMRFLPGGISLLVQDDSGELAQWFWQTFDGEYRLQKVRSFQAEKGSPLVVSEQRRKGFAVINETGLLQIVYTTSSRIVLEETIAVAHPVQSATLAPRGDYLLIEDGASQIHVWAVDNEHPQVSFTALWDEVWYESYSAPAYVWQSSAANIDFEPKYSFAPLAFGTLKAAFYSMLLATPLAICAAIYTAFFMAPMLRRKIKPLVELMEALPTVVLGFLAGLWLAPFVENNLPAIFSILILFPPSVVLFAWAWSRLPPNLSSRVPKGYHSVLLIPVVFVLAYLCIAVSQTMELYWFNGDARTWLSNDLGISFDQRNALIVGVAMGFAVIPTIYSLAEDAIFAVPRHLANGSLALGATPWQTMILVILPTASPGIFSATMIGFGRAVGETMIVLMATGNTPIMDVNVFEGMRTLAANIAIEVPEAEVDSTHYRVLFLSAFVLFVFTFLINTSAEVVRQRLRDRYGEL